MDSARRPARSQAKDVRVTQHLVELVSILLVLLQVVPAAQSLEMPWAITGTTLIDGTGAPPLKNAVVVGRGDHLTCVGRVSDCRLPEGTTIVEGTGKWMIPGLIDTHIHPNWSKRGSTPQWQAARLAFGITATRDAGTPGVLLANLARRETARLPNTAEPRLMVSAVVSQEHMERYDEHDVGRLVTRLAALGPDAIKLKREFTSDEYRSIVGAAHAAGLPVFGHTWGPSGSQLEPAVAAGVDGLSHMATFSAFGERADAGRPPEPEGLAYWIWVKEQWNYEDEARLSGAIAKIVAQGVWLEPMLVSEKYFTLPYPFPDDVSYLGDVLSLEQLLRTSLPVGDTGWVRRRLRRDRLAVVYAHMCDIVRQFHARGGVVITGTDDVAPGPGLLDEIGLLIGCGFTPMEALQAATAHAATALKQQDIGTIVPGKLADLVILNGDPLSDPANLRRVWRVVKGSQIYDPAVLMRPAIASYHARLLWAWGARIASGVALAGMLTVLNVGYRRVRGRSE
jgi:imidazolonepropionase-like amidohydrolase